MAVMVLKSAHYFLFICLILSNLAPEGLLCLPPYECLTTSQCAKNLAEDSTVVLFRCEDGSKICCPLIKTINRNCTSCLTDVNTVVTTAIPSKTEKQSPTRKRPLSHENLKFLPSMCGSNGIPDRITEGEEANLGEFPWMALVGIRDRLGNLEWFCGGTLISHRYILTAAHCVYQKNETVPVVRLGEHNLQNSTDCDKNTHFCLDPPIDLDVEEVILHENWNSTTIKNDIALFRLPQNVTASDSVSPICLPLNMKKIDTSGDIKYEVAGWGKAEWNAQSGSSILRKGTLSSITNENCNLCKGKKKERYCPISDKQICAQGWKSVDVCKGDSGGPLMSVQQKTYQIGITSFKTSEYCGADNIPSVFTRVESYLNWILNNIRE